LYLGVFSGPVEGILMIVTIFMITGFMGTSKTADYEQALNPAAGPTFWDQNVLTLTRLENIEWIASHVPNIGINVCFMIFSIVALAFNIVTRCVLIFACFVPR
jgi:ethanolaminephosphotransferase